jgi:hypothetical protein
MYSVTWRAPWFLTLLSSDGADAGHQLQDGRSGSNRRKGRFYPSVSVAIMKLPSRKRAGVLHLAQPRSQFHSVLAARVVAQSLLHIEAGLLFLGSHALLAFQGP